MRLSELKALLAAHGLAPQARFGQNFLVDPALLAAIPGDAGVAAGERILEVGPGAGALTRELLGRGAQVYAVEVDHGLCQLLRKRFAGEIEERRLCLLEADVLASGERFHPEVESWWGTGAPPRVVANLPYQISGPFLGRLPGRALAGATLLLQREVADKAAGRADAGPLPVRLELSFHLRLGRRLPPSVFWPRPRVDSAFLHLQRRSDAPSAPEDRCLAGVLKLAYSQRRKHLLKRLQTVYPEAAGHLRGAGISDQARAAEVTANLWLQAARAELATHG